MPLVVRVFKASHGGLSSSDQVGELCLGDPGGRPSLVDHRGHLGIETFIGDHLPELGVIAREPIEDLRRILGFLLHVQISGPAQAAAKRAHA